MGVVRAGYHDAAVLAGWTLAATQDSLNALTVQIEGVCTAQHDYWLHYYRPLCVRLHVGERVWCWNVDVVRVDGMHLTLRCAGIPHVE